MPEELIKDKSHIERIPLYIEGLDDQMEGGIPAGQITLVCGTAGTMKSSLSFNVMYNEVLNGKTALYITLEQSAVSLLNHMTNMGFDSSKVNILLIKNLSDIEQKLSMAKGKGTLVLADIAVIRKEIKSADTRIGPTGDWINVLKNIVRKMKEHGQLDLFTLDSLSALYVISKFDNPRTELFYYYEFLRDLDIPTFLIPEMPLDKSRYGEYGVEDFLADGVIRLELVERQRKTNREITVIK